MVKAFDDAVFAMKPGEIVGPVQSEFGFHVIKLAGITPARTLSFDEAKGAARGRSQAAEGRAEVRGRRGPVPEPCLRAGRFARGCREGARRSRRRRRSGRPAPTRSGSRSATRSSSRRSSRRSRCRRSATPRRSRSAPNTLMAGRVVEYKPAAPRPFDDVKDEIRRQLVAPRSERDGAEARAARSSRCWSRARATRTPV